MKIIDDLSREDIPLYKIQGFCTNLVRESDNWHTITEMIDDSATKIISRDQAIDSEYQVFALYYDGRPEGSVWYPVKVTRSE